MSTDNPEHLSVDGAAFSIGIVAARYNFNRVNALLESVLETLKASGVDPENIEVFRVPGSHELPFAVAMAARTDAFDAVIALGVVIAGETSHHQVIADSTARALQEAGLHHAIPVINGILAVDTPSQADERITGSLRRGVDFARAALEMAVLNAELQTRIDNRSLDLDLEDLDWLDELDEDDGPEDWKR